MGPERGLVRGWKAPGRGCQGGEGLVEPTWRDSCWGQTKGIKAGAEEPLDGEGERTA